MKFESSSGGPGLAGVTAVLYDALAVMAGVGARAAEAPSACAGWSVKDVLAHMMLFLETLADPRASEPIEDTEEFEPRADVQVAAVRDLSLSDVVTRYASLVDPVLATLAAVEQLPPGPTFGLGTLGRYPLSSSKDALCFDTLVHVRHDVLGPRGPLGEDPLPALDDVRLAPALRWALSGVPQMSGRPLAEALTEEVTLQLTGVGATAATLVPAEPGGTVSVTAPRSTDIVITSDAQEFLLWSTHRAPWRQQATVSGDVARAEAIVSAIRVV